MADDVHAIINELAPTYPYSYSVVHDMNGQLASGYAPQPPCSAATFTSFVTCLTTHCTGATTEAQAAACIAANCSTEFFDLSDDCLGCYRTAGFDFSNIVTRFVIVILSIQ